MVKDLFNVHLVRSGFTIITDTIVQVCLIQNLKSTRNKPFECDKCCTTRNVKCNTKMFLSLPYAAGDIKFSESDPDINSDIKSMNPV